MSIFYARYSCTRTLFCRANNRAHSFDVNNSKCLGRSTSAMDWFASMAATPNQFSVCERKEENNTKKWTNQLNQLCSCSSVDLFLLTWNSFKLLQYGSVCRQPITTAFRCGYRWHIPNNADFTVPRIISILIGYCFWHSTINSSISSNELSGWMYKQSNVSFGCRLWNKFANICSNTVQSLPPLKDRKISLDSYVSSVLFSICFNTNGKAKSNFVNFHHDQGNFNGDKIKSITYLNGTANLHFEWTIGIGFINTHFEKNS